MTDVDVRAAAAAIRWAPVVGALLAAAAVPAADEPWQGSLAVLLAALVVVGVSARTRRRFGGVTGDVLGAVCELSVLVTLVVTAA